MNVLSRLAKVTVMATVAFLLAVGCGPEKPTPEKLFGIWMGKNPKGRISYTFILGGKCEIAYPDSKRKNEDGTWKIDGTKVNVESTDGTVALDIDGYDLASGDKSVTVHKLGME